MPRFREKLTEQQRAGLVTFNGYRYGTLDFTPFSETAIGTQSAPIKLKPSWELAPNEPDIVTHVIAAHPWGTHVLVAADGSGFYTRANPAPGNILTTGVLREEGGGYVPSSSSLRILIRARAPRSEEGHCKALMLDMWKRRVLTDCEVHCSDKVFPCHRAVLAHASPVFEKMLTSEMEEARQQRIVIRDAEPQVVEALLEFSYTGKLACGEEDVVNLLSLADCYQMRSLVQVCAEEAVASVSADNVLGVIRATRSMRMSPDIAGTFDRLLKKVKDNDSFLLALVDSA
mmetsp:Transcript_113488/g.321438  ORF Transcript_113488/g.321438 Transcript_113488/m.321438 type:complete len:287 (-) Transcript_113488:79-939(-)